MRVAIGLVVVTSVALASGCSRYTPKDAVRQHIEAAAAGNVSYLREHTCGDLAKQLATHTDDEVRAAFVHYYEPKPDRFNDHDATESPVMVEGYYTGVTDLDIAFVTEDNGHGYWKVCEVRKGNGIFGTLPGPFG
ncbi:hypothetical protein LTV02_05215 [Nocardia yamanashiensis]|uniref:hypothetical protein n=1 Tax=Nocardia yamanashiensis TaxID=209247 RepID=UPI001E3C0FC4|nr:hypothetical protein [Nocardia yamanashiensis]UGT42805.1 hypothetical protein LTV02_05215 [Nocardia yamanashiensis]